MKLKLAGILLSLAALQGCNSGGTPSGSSNLSTDLTNPPTTAQPQVVATVRGEPVTIEDLDRPLVEGYGLNVLLLIVQRELVKHEAGISKIVVTPADIDAERKLTVMALKRAAQREDDSNTPSTKPSDDEVTPDEADRLLGQLLTQEHLSAPEFNIILETNAYLRKIASPEIEKQLTDDAVRKQFNLMYGEKVVVHYIVCNNMADVENVRRDLAAGKSFEEVAKVRSIDRITGPNGGELPPFTLQDNRFPEVFKQIAFSMKKGEISDPVQINPYIYVIKLTDRIAPGYAKFEDYREAVRKDLYDQAIAAAMAAQRRSLAKMAIDAMHIKDPVLLQQWQERLARKDGEVRDMNEIRRKLDQEHARSTTRATTTPSKAATLPSATQPALAPATSPAAH